MLYKSRHWPIDDRRRFRCRRSGLLVGVLRQRSDVDLLRDLNCVVNLDAEVANGALDLGMSEQLGFIRRIS